VKDLSNLARGGLGPGPGPPDRQVTHKGIVHVQHLLDFSLPLVNERLALPANELLGDGWRAEVGKQPRGARPAPGRGRGKPAAPLRFPRTCVRHTGGSRVPSAQMLLMEFSCEFGRWAMIFSNSSQFCAILGTTWTGNSAGVLGAGTDEAECVRYAG
jgi:hypothetical protein